MATETTPGDRPCSFFESDFLDGYDGDNDSDDFYANLQVSGGGYEGPYRFLHDENEEEDEFQPQTQQQICDFATSLRYSILEPIQEEQEEISEDDDEDDDDDDDDLQQSDCESRSSEVWCWGDDFTSDGAESVIYVGDRNTTLSENTETDALKFHNGQKRDMNELGEGNWLDSNGQEVKTPKLERGLHLKKMDDEILSKASRSMPDLHNGAVTSVDSSGDSDLIIVFDEYKTKGTRSLKKSKTSPNLNDVCMEEPSSADAWSDAIDAYLDILRYPHESPGYLMSSGTFHYDIGQSEVLPASDINRESCTTRSPILSDDLPMTKDKLESSPSEFFEKDGQMMTEFQSLNIENNNEDEFQLEKSEMKLTSRLHGVRSSPSLLGDDGSHCSESSGDDVTDNYLFSHNVYTGGLSHNYPDVMGNDYSKSRSEPCVKSASLQPYKDGEFSNNEVTMEQALSPMIKYFYSDLNECRSGVLNKCKSFESEYDDYSTSDSSSSEEEDFNTQFRASSMFQRGFALTGTLRSFRSFDALNLAGHNLDENDDDYFSGSISHLPARHSWTMDNIEESTAEEQTDVESKLVRPSSEDLSEDSGYSDRDKAICKEDHRLDSLLGHDIARRDRVQLLASTRKSSFGYSDEIRSTCVCALNGVTICAHEHQLWDSDESDNDPELPMNSEEFETKNKSRLNTSPSQNNTEVDKYDIPKLPQMFSEKMESKERSYINKRHDSIDCHNPKANSESVSNRLGNINGPPSEFCHHLEATTDSLRKLDTNEVMNEHYLLNSPMYSGESENMESGYKENKSPGNDGSYLEEQHSDVRITSDIITETTLNQTSNGIELSANSKLLLSQEMPTISALTEFQHQTAPNKREVESTFQINSLTRAMLLNPTNGIGFKGAEVEEPETHSRETINETSKVECKVEVIISHKSLSNVNNDKEVQPSTDDTNSSIAEYTLSQDFDNNEQQSNTPSTTIVHFHEFFYSPQKNAESRKVTSRAKFSSFSTSDSEIYNSAVTTMLSVPYCSSASPLIDSSIYTCGMDNTCGKIDKKESPLSSGRPPLSPCQLAPCRAKIINERNKFFTSQDLSSLHDFDGTQEGTDNASTKDNQSFEVLAETFRQRAKEGRERIAKTILNLNEIERNFLQNQQENSQISEELLNHHKNNTQETQNKVNKSASTLDSTSSETSEGHSINSSFDSHSNADNNTSSFCIKDVNDKQTLDCVENKLWVNNHDCTGKNSLYHPSVMPSTPLNNGSYLNNQSYGYLETDIDTLHSREVIIQYPEIQRNAPFRNSGYHSVQNMKTQSMLNLTSELKPVARPDTLTDSNDPRAKSMEFLLNNDENLAALLPPENQLMAAAATQKGGGNSSAKLSEHELRIRQSLQKLDLPDWYTNSPLAQMGSQEGFILRNHNDKSASKVSTRPRWQDVKSQSSSTSLQLPCSGKNVIISKRVTGPDWRHVKLSQESLLQNPIMPSPPLSHSAGNNFQYNYNPSMSRWSSSHLSTSMGMPQPLNLTSPFQRQPYLGWRSSEQIARQVTEHSGTSTPSNGTGFLYRTSAERLSHGPGYYSMRFGGISHSLGSSDGNLSPVDVGDHCNSGMSTSTTSPETSNTSSSVVMPKPDDDINILEPNGCCNSDSNHLDVAELVRKIDSLIQRDGPIIGDNSSVEYRTRDIGLPPAKRLCDSEREYINSSQNSVAQQQPTVWMESSFVGVKPHVVNSQMEVKPSYQQCNKTSSVKSATNMASAITNS